MMRRWPYNLKSGFTLVELLVVIVFLFILVGLLLPNVNYVRERAVRVNCLSNLNGIWKSVSAWKLDPNKTYVSNFPASNLAGLHGILTPFGGVSPELFICPTAAGDYGTRPAKTLSEMTASNSSYCYFGGRSDKDGDKVLLCDQDGPVTIATTNHWGGNHSVPAGALHHRGKHGLAQGGNIIKVSGSGMWVSTKNDPDGAAYCITNAAISAAFQTDTNIVVSLY